MHLTYRKTCRVCGSSSLKKVIDLGEQYLQGSFVKPGKERPPSRKIPTELVRCNPLEDENACGLLQMAHSVPTNILYSSYWYRSGTNQTMRDHLKSIVHEMTSMTAHKEAPCTLDIGCNDGTLLSYYPDHYRKFGVDPSDIALEIKGNVHVIRDVFPSVELAETMNGSRFDIITSIAMFYDLEDPVGFAKSIKSSLAADGLWCFEMSYMPKMLELNSYDTICHEHLEYYSLAVIEHILRRADLQLVRLQMNDINGGSIRCYATHRENFRFKNQAFLDEIENVRRAEFELELDTDKPYRYFQERINVHKYELQALLKKLKNENKTIHIYGASTKGNTILQWCNIDKAIVDCAADRNPDKHGAATLGSNIPIISEQHSREMNPDYYLVLPWHFKDEFLQREKEILRKSTSMIFPLPHIEIIKH